MEEETKHGIALSRLRWYIYGYLYYDLKIIPELKIRCLGINCLLAGLYKLSTKWEISHSTSNNNMRSVQDVRSLSLYYYHLLLILCCYYYNCFRFYFYLFYYFSYSARKDISDYRAIFLQDFTSNELWMMMIIKIMSHAFLLYVVPLVPI